MRNVQTLQALHSQVPPLAEDWGGSHCGKLRRRTASWCG